MYRPLTGSLRGLGTLSPLFYCQRNSHLAATPHSRSVTAWVEVSHEGRNEKCPPKPPMRGS